MTTTDPTTTETTVTSAEGEVVDSADTLAVDSADAPADDVTTDDPPAEDNQDDAEDDKGSRKASREAARYRTALRAAEAERDALTARVETMQRAEAERMASARLSVGGDLFDVGRLELAALLDDDGNVSPDAVREAVTALVRTRPGLAAAPPRAPRPDPSQGGGGGNAIGESADEGWGKVLSGGRRK